MKKRKLFDEIMEGFASLAEQRKGGHTLKVHKITAKSPRKKARRPVRGPRPGS